MTTKPVSILSIGEPMAEFTRQADGRFLQGVGGDTSNLAISAARQGASVGMVTRLGQDWFGDEIAALWDREGVDGRLVIRDPSAPTAAYFVDPDPAARAFTYFRAGSAASRLHPDDLPEDVLRAASIVHLSGITQAISASACDAGFRAIEVARSAGVDVSYDTNLRLGLWPLDRARAVMHAAMARSTIALPSLDDSRLLTGIEDSHDIALYYKGLGPRIVALKCGAEGVVLAFGDKISRIPPLEVDAVDSTGAGDAFGGAFLARLVAGDTPLEAARYANVVAALTTTGHGALPAIPLAPEVAAYLGAT